MDLWTTMPKNTTPPNNKPDIIHHPLPAGWDVGRDYDGKIYYINHLEKRTTWIDPRISSVSSSSCSDVDRREGPKGVSPPVPPSSHLSNKAQDAFSSDPPQHPPRNDEWKAVQENMLKQYLATAEIDLRAKEELAEIKEQRLSLARDEYLHLSKHLNIALSTSTTSLNSTGSCLSTKYDPDLLRADVIHAKSRVQRLKRELVNIDSEMAYKQKGVETLSRVNEKFSSSQIPPGITLEEAQAIKLELYNIHQSLSTGEQEKVELVKSLACLKDDLTRLQPSESSLDDVSSLEARLLSTASQTDLSGELVPVGTRLAEMARLRLRYDDARRQVQDIQQSLANLEEKMSPGQLESDKDRLLLIQEKEQLLRELRSIRPRSRSTQEMLDIKKEILKLESDLNKAMEVSNRCIAERLKVHEEKQLLLQQLMEAMKSVSRLESQLKLLSASTLSMSSSSSLGSLSSSHASSKGSLSSLSFTDIYGLSSGDPATLLDLHKRVDKILVGSSSNDISSSSSSSSTNQGPSNEEESNGVINNHLGGTGELALMSSSAIDQQQRTQKHLDKHFGELSLGTSPSLLADRKLPFCGDKYLLLSSAELSTISESASEALTEDATSGVTSGGPSAPRRRSTGDSLAGDSGVFEAPPPVVPMSSKAVNSRIAVVPPHPPSSVSLDGSGGGLSSLMNLETAQVQIKLKYFTSDSVLQVGIERARNLSALLIPKKGKICVKAALLPFTSSSSSSNLSFCTRVLSDLRKPSFGESFPLAVPIKKLISKTLQITIWSFCPEGKEECLGSAQVSLADFDPSKGTCLRWYNVLSFHFMQQPGERCKKQLQQIQDPNSGSSSIFPGASTSKSTNGTGGGGTLKEESSDDSTIISSQTSTLTRNVPPETMLLAAGTGGDLLYYQEEYEEEEEERSNTTTSSCKVDDIVILTTAPPSSEACFEDPRQKELSDKETNTEHPGGLSNPSSPCKRTIQQRIATNDALIKRSQTFSPSASHLSKNDYICRLNRSDSDSAMPLYKRLSFQRSMSERRSLRIPMSFSSSSSSSGRAIRHLSKSSHPRRKKSSSSSSRLLLQTPLDLELDLAAQKTKLELLQEEIDRLKLIKRRMEEARENGERELPNWLADQDHFQKLLSQVELNDQKSSEDRKFEKLVRKSGRDIYKLRKTRTPKGKLDIYSFREKMAFFTSLKTSVPILPVPEEDCLIADLSDEPLYSNVEEMALYSKDVSSQQSPKTTSPTTTTITNSTADNQETSPEPPTSTNPSNPEQPSTKFTYEIDPVIGVIV